MGKNRWISNDFEVNKDNQDAVVYQSVMGTIYVNKDDIPDVDPEIAGEYFRNWIEADPERNVAGAYFQFWKEISDKGYGDIYNDDHTESRRCYLINDFSPYEDKADKTYAEKVRSAKLAEQLNTALELLTDTQRRRLHQYYSDKMSVRKIADLEHVDHKTVFDSIKAARAKIKDYFEKL